MQINGTCSRLSTDPLAYDLAGFAGLGDSDNHILRNHPQIAVRGFALRCTKRKGAYWRTWRPFFRPDMTGFSIPMTTTFPVQLNIFLQAGVKCWLI